MPAAVTPVPTGITTVPTTVASKSAPVEAPEPAAVKSTPMKATPMKATAMKSTAGAPRECQALRCKEQGRGKRNQSSFSYQSQSLHFDHLR